MVARAIILALLGMMVGHAHAQVVQLPSLHTFSVQTSVLVPDSGGAYLAGANRSSHWMASRGPGWGPLGRNRGRGGEVSTGGMSIRATIIDNHELDELVLEEARALRAEKGIELPDDSRPRIARPRDTAPASLAAIKRELAAEDAALEAEAERDFQRAQAYERAGEASLARNYYRVAARKSNGLVKQKSVERLAALPAVPSKSMP